MRSIVCIVLMGACVHRVDVRVSATPTVMLEDDSVAVTAVSKDCRDVADELIHEFQAIPGITVHPHADLRVDVVECGESWQVELETEVGLESPTRDRLHVHGRAYALVAVRTGTHVHAHLVGSSRTNEETAWDVPLRPNTLWRNAQRGQAQRVAADLAFQLDPSTREVARRVYPRAPAGTAREFHSLAVAAEGFGDLDTAYYLAAAAHDQNPTLRSASYRDELARRRLVYASAPLP